MTGAKSKQLTLGVNGRCCKALKAIARGKVEEKKKKKEECNLWWDVGIESGDGISCCGG